MYKVVSLALLVAGVVLAILGISVSPSSGPGTFRFFTDSPNEKAIRMLVGRMVLFAIGLAGLSLG